MKKISFIKYTYILFLIVLIASCASNHFGSRKYTAGNYIENRHKLQKIKSNETPINLPVYASIERGLTVSDFKLTTNESEVVLENKNPSSFEKIKNSKKINDQIKSNAGNLKQNLTKIRKAKPSNIDSKKIDIKALLGFIFAMVAIICICSGLLLMSGYVSFFAGGFLLFMFGLIFGVIGFSFGVKGKKNYKKNDGSTIDLSFSTVAIILGIFCLIALIAAVIILLFLALLLLLM